MLLSGLPLLLQEGGQWSCATADLDLSLEQYNLL